MRVIEKRSSAAKPRTLRSYVTRLLERFGRWAADFEHRERARFHGKRAETFPRKAPINNRVARRRIAREKRSHGN